MNETELLARFAQENSEAAFSELVTAKISLVYAAALRRVGGDVHLAQDVTQGVFIALATNAEALRRHRNLTGWLFTTTRFVSAKALRSQFRRQRWESAAEIADVHATDSDGARVQLGPIVDDVIDELREADRRVVLLRYFEGRSYADIGQVLGVTENTARMRADRALDKLRTKLKRRGITSTAAALSVVFADQTATAIPATLTSQVAHVALSASAAATLSLGMSGGGSLIYFMTMPKLTVGVLSAIALLGIGAYVGSSTFVRRDAAATAHDSQTSAELVQLRAENARMSAALAASRRDALARSAATSASARTDIMGQRNKWKLLAELQRRKMVQARISFLRGDGTLDDTMASLFDLTPEEHQALIGLIDRTRERIEALERENATVSRNPDGSVVIAVKPFPDRGGSVYDDLMRGVAGTLGDERNTAFLTLCSDQVEKALGAFGATQRTVTVSRRVDGSRPLVATDERISPNNTFSDRSDYSSQEDLLNRIGTIAKLLPPEMFAGIAANSPSPDPQRARPE